jgi:hypothetical protein
MHVALDARVSTADKDQNPETQLQPLRMSNYGRKGVLGHFCG